MPSISPARRVAFDVLMRVESGAWASDLLRAASSSLDSRDAGLASEIVFGTLRRQLQLDEIIAAHTRKTKLDAEVRIALRMGLYQILHLTRVPAHAAVMEGVELVKFARKRSAAGLVNAVLRAASKGVSAPSLLKAAPAWLLSRWAAVYGTEAAMQIAESSLRPPKVYVRSLTPPDVPHEATDVAGGWRILSGDAGDARQQDIGSQWVVTLLDLRPGQLFLDLCAAPGNKTAHALEFGVHAVAADLHLHRLRGFTAPCPLVNLDATYPLPFRPVFDRILVDAPCSGTGTLSRNPEIKWRLTPADLADLHGRQVRILRHALEVLKPGGTLVYSTCSLEPEENEAVLEEVLGLIPDDTYRRLPGVHAGDGFFASIIHKPSVRTPV